MDIVGLCKIRVNAMLLNEDISKTERFKYGIHSIDGSDIRPSVQLNLMTFYSNFSAEASTFGNDFGV